MFEILSARQILNVVNTNSTETTSNSDDYEINIETIPEQEIIEINSVSENSNNGSPGSTSYHNEELDLSEQSPTSSDIQDLLDLEYLSIL